MERKNREIRVMMEMSGIKQCELAARMGIKPQSINRMLRYEMKPEKKAVVIGWIQRIKKEKASYEQGTRMGKTS